MSTDLGADEGQNFTNVPFSPTLFPDDVGDYSGSPKNNNISADSATGSSTTDFYIGLGLAIGSSVFIGTSFIIKKKALIKLASFDVRPSEGGYGYLREWLWWAGVITMGIGEACNFAAYAFAPASLVTPLGALSVLVTAVLSSRMLNEKLNLLGKIGCAICLLGSTVIVLNSPKEEEVSTMEELGLKMRDAVILISLGLIFYVAPRYGRSNILVYIAVCSVIGSLSVVSVKGLGLAIKETIGGNQQITNPLSWFWLMSVVGCVTVQLVYLNKALDIYNTSMVTPIYYVFFTTFVIIASGILFKEWANLDATAIVGNIAGFLITVIGIFQMQLFRDVNITLRQLRYLLHKPANGLNADPSSSTGIGGSNHSFVDALGNSQASLVENGDLVRLARPGAGWSSSTSSSTASTHPRTLYS